MDKYEIIKEESDFILLKHIETKKMTVVKRGSTNQILSAMPGDLSKDYGGVRFATLSDNGIEYVSSLYSPSYARRIYNTLVSSQREYRGY